MSSPESRASRPNIILILSDDQGWGDLSCKGNANLSTPAIDALSRGGAVFDYFYVQPLCAPTRAEILTGRYFPRTGVKGVTRRAERINLDETTLGDVFKAADYATGYFGKWHSGSAYPYHPNGRGFDEFFGFCCGHWSHYFASTLERNGEEIKSEGYIVDAFTNEAMGFIERSQQQQTPFLCYLALNTPHSPFQVPDSFFDKFKNDPITMRHREPEKENLDITRSVLAMCENIDWNVSRVVEKLAALDITNDTIIIYLSDNGPNGWRWNGGMKGKKGSTDEGGVRSPCSITWPGHIAPETVVQHIAGGIDLLPTLTDLTGIDTPKAKPLDGISLRPLLENPQTESWAERAIFAHSANGLHTAIRTQEYRAGGESGGLYDLNLDIGQTHDLAAEKPQVYQDLRDQIQTWRADVMPRLSDSSDGDRPIPVGYAEFPTTYLPAQDGIPSGDITWSSIHPNASFFVQWGNLDDDIHWDIDVQQSGAYDVTLMYTCQTENVGATVEVTFQNERLAGTITEAFEPPLKDGEDRVMRDESYEKEFAPWQLGVIQLTRGRSDFRLRAQSKTGSGIIDLRAIKLTLLAP